MRLISLRIENFGKLSGEELNFSEGINVLNRDNGWGKTTLAEFLCTMLYGFAGESKRSELENERKRYTPWQGGVYGGQLIFSEKGKTYLLTRTFGAKAEGDSFELRDGETNLPSGDFTEKIGEELFGIDRESFRKTIFIGQSDCRAGATDGIHAKLGNLTAEQDDLSRYEKADKALADKCNELTERRKTGEGARLAAEVTRLKTAVSQTAHLEDSLQALREKIRLQQGQMERSLTEQKKLEEVQKKVSLQQDRMAKRSVYRSLCQTEEADKARVDDLRVLLPDQLPSEEDLDQAMDLMRKLDTAKTAMEMTELSEKQKEDLRICSERFLSGIPDQEAFDDIWSKSEEVDRMREEDKETARKQEKKDKRALTIGITGLLLGVVALILAVLIYQWQGSMPLAGKILAAVGAILALLGILLTTAPLRHREKEKYRAMQRRETEENLAGEVTDFLSAYGLQTGDVSPEKALGRLEGDARRYEELLDAREIYAGKEAAYTELRQQADRCLEKFALIPGSGERDRLQDLARKLAEYRNAEATWKRDVERRAAFEKENDMTDLSEEEENLPSMESLSEQIRDLTGQVDNAKDLIRTYEKQVEDLEEQKEERDRAEVLLSAREEELEAARTAFARLSLAKDFLTEARNRMTARYTQPLLDRFGYYYHVLTGQDSGAYHMDASAALTLEEYGRQREIAFLSSGYQDLLGVCQRLAFADLMFEETSMPFLLMDDPFVNLDSEKIRGAKILLEDLAHRYQVIYLSCNKERVPLGLSRNEL